MSWGVFPYRRTGLSSLLDPLLDSSLLDPLLESFSLDPLEFFLLGPLLESSLDPLWGLPLLDYSSLSQSKSELLPSLGHLSLCPGCSLLSVV